LFYNRGSIEDPLVNALTAFGLFAVTAMLVCYALEKRSAWFIFAFALACALASVYGFLQGAWPFGAVEAVWSLVALRRWWLARVP
jgi:hypothetical protein